MYRVGKHGQITIRSEIRKQLGIEPGMLVYQRVVNGHLEVIFLPGPHRESLYGVFHQEGEPLAIATSDDLEEAVMEAIAEAAE